MKKHMMSKSKSTRDKTDGLRAELTIDKMSDMTVNPNAIQNLDPRV